jgi:hypothetical protein
MELLDPGSNFLFALSMSESGSGVFFGLCLPVLCLFCWLEYRVFTDGGVCVGKDLFDILRANTVSKIGSKLFLETRES